MMLLAKQFLIKFPLASCTFMFHPGSKVKIIKIDINFPNDMRHCGLPGPDSRLRQEAVGQRMISCPCHYFMSDLSLSWYEPYAWSLSRLIKWHFYERSLCKRLASFHIPFNFWKLSQFCISVLAFYILRLRLSDIVNCNLSDLMKLKIAEIDICKLSVKTRWKVSPLGF